jgi:hypothetical protein
VKRALLIGAVLVLTIACASFFHLRNGQRIDVEELNRLSSAVTKVSASLESTVRYESPPSDAADKALLELATKHEPAMLTPFASYLVRAKQQDKHGVVLVCSMDGSQALLEDLGCTAHLDAAHFRSEAAKPCEFSVSISEACRTVADVDAGL